MKKAAFLFFAATLYSTGAYAQKKAKDSVTEAATKLEQGVTSPEGKRTGKWNFFTSKKELELTFDYDSSRIKFQQPDTTRYLLRVGEEWLPKVPGRPPHFLGSTDQHLLDLNKRLRYPISALQQHLQGTMLISYVVGVDGHTQDYSVESSLSPDCDQEVWQAIKALPDNWIPAVYLGRPIPARFYLAVQFRMMDKADFDRQAHAEKRSAVKAGVSAPADDPALPGSAHYAHKVFVTAVGVARDAQPMRVGR